MKEKQNANNEESSQILIHLENKESIKLIENTLGVYCLLLPL